MSKRDIYDFFLYLIVGAIATITEWILFFILNDSCKWNYMLATVLAYIISTFVNWLAGRIILFKKSKKTILYELFGVYAASVIGLLLNIAIMWLLVEAVSINSMVAKMIATGLVFLWNFFIRKKVIYKE